MAKDRLFSVHNVNGTLTNPELAYPWRHEYIPIWLSGLLSVMVPILVYILMALRIRSFWDLNNAVCQALWKFNTDFSDISRSWVRVTQSLALQSSNLQSRHLSAASVRIFLIFVNQISQIMALILGVALTACTCFFPFPITDYALSHIGVNATMPTTIT